MSLFKHTRIAVLLFALALLFSATTVTSAQDERPLLRIVATTTQAGDLAAILSGDLLDEHVQITTLMGAGVDPHLYQPAEADIAAMNTARMVIYSGLGLEGKFDAVFAALGERGVLVYPLSRAVEEAGFVIGAFDQEAAVEGADDPHFWFDPRNWQITALDLAEVLGRLDPDHADIYLANAEAYAEQLDLLYAWADEGLRQIPGRQRYLVTSHDAFQYFVTAFGWRAVGVQGISTEEEAGVGDIQGTVNFVISNNIPVLFVESSVSPRTVEAVKEAVRVGGGQVSTGVRELYSDAMGEPGTFGGTYVGMIAENVITILQSYGYPVPEWPEGLQPAPPAELFEID